MAHALRTYRDTNGLTLDALAARLGVTKGFLSKIERGQSMPSLALAGRIAAVTDGAVSANDFLPSAAPSEAAE